MHERTHSTHTKQAVLHSHVGGHTHRYVCVARARVFAFVLSLCPQKWDKMTHPHVVHLRKHGASPGEPAEDIESVRARVEDSACSVTFCRLQFIWLGGRAPEVFVLGLSVCLSVCLSLSLSLSLCLSLSLSLSVFLSLSLSTSTLLTLSTCSWQGQEFGLEDSQVPQAPGTSSHLRQAYHPVSRTVMRAYKHYNDDTR